MQIILLFVVSACTFLVYRRLAARNSEKEVSVMTGTSSIKTRLQSMVLLISATALIITSVMGVLIMMLIRSQSELALIT